MTHLGACGMNGLGAWRSMAELEHGFSILFARQERPDRYTQQEHRLSDIIPFYKALVVPRLPIICKMVLRPCHATNPLQAP